jgi:hypothetical protein
MRAEQHIHTSKHGIVRVCSYVLYVHTCGLLPSSQMETLLFRDLWFCAIPTFDRPCSFIQPMPQRRSQSNPTLPNPHLGLRNRPRPLSNVIPVFYISILPIGILISLSHITQSPITLQITTFYTTLLQCYIFIWIILLFK